MCVPSCSASISNLLRIQQLENKLQNTRQLATSINAKTDKVSDALGKMDGEIQKQITENNRIISEHIHTYESEKAANDQRLVSIEGYREQSERRITQLESENAELKQTVSKMKKLITGFTTRLMQLEAKQRKDKAALEENISNLNRSHKTRGENGNPLTSPLTSDDEGD